MRISKRRESQAAGLRFRAFVGGLDQTGIGFVELQRIHSWSGLLGVAWTVVVQDPEGDPSKGAGGELGRGVGLLQEVPEISRCIAILHDGKNRTGNLVGFQDVPVRRIQSLVDDSAVGNCHPRGPSQATVVEFQTGKKHGYQMLRVAVQELPQEVGLALGLQQRGCHPFPAAVPLARPFVAHVHPHAAGHALRFHDVESVGFQDQMIDLRDIALLLQPQVVEHMDVLAVLEGAVQVVCHL